MVIRERSPEGRRATSNVSTGHGGGRVNVELSHVEKRVLLALGEEGGDATPEDLLEGGYGFDAIVEVMNGANWLQSKGLINIDEHLTTYLRLGNEGEEVLDRGLPERRALDALVEAPGGRLNVGELAASGAVDGPEVPIAIGWLKRKGLADISKEDGDTILTLTDVGRTVADGSMADEAVLEAVAEGGEVPAGDLDEDGLEVLLGRQDLVRKRESVTRVLHVTSKGERVLDEGIELTEAVAQLTAEHLRDGAWRDLELRRYDVQAFAPTATGGKKHPLRQIIDRVRSIFLEMGFSEMEGSYVRSAFWNMDVLFTPQDHPARAMQDTFYVEDPAQADLSGDGELVERVRAVHEDGGDTGSRGWRTPWSLEEAQRMLLRTHTTVDSVKYLHEHPREPCKVFSVDRVFRNEVLDRTHLPEFHQVEGIVMEPGANFQMLVGLFREFYSKLGFPDVRVRPAYFPYTEPSLEIEVMHAGEWMELGGAGIFRPEVTEPLGVEWPVLAWGLGLERLAMMVLDLEDIRDLYVSDVEWLRESEVLE